MILDQSEQNLTGFLQTVKIGGAESYAGGRSTYVTVGALSLWENSLPHVGVLKDARQVWAVFPRPALHVCAPASGCVLAALEKKMEC